MREERGNEYLETGDVLEFEARLNRRLFLHGYGLLELAVPIKEMPDQMMSESQCFRVRIEAIEDPWHIEEG